MNDEGAKKADRHLGGEHDHRQAEPVVTAHTYTPSFDILRFLVRYSAVLFPHPGQNRVNGYRVSKAG
jgi:hypothetical protein